jgi:hypothetical protein
VKRKKMFWLLLIPIVLSIAIIPSRSAIIKTWLLVSPEETWCRPGDTFSVNILVSYVTPMQALWAYQIEMSYDPDVIHGVSVEDGPFMESDGGTAVFIEGEGFDDTIGKLSLCGAYLDPIANFPSGMYETLAIVTFEVVGEGTSDLVLGPDSALINSAGRIIEMKPSLPGVVIGQAGPELYVRRRGAHGGGVWPEWHVGAVCEDQTLYARILNYGETAAQVYVDFEVSSTTFGTQKPTSNVDTVPAATWVADDIVPGEIVVSVTFHPPGPAVFTVSGKLFFKAGPLTDFVYYGMDGIALPGEADTRDIATKYKVA